MPAIGKNARGCTERFRRDGVFRIYFSLGKDPATGKYLRTPKRVYHCKSRNPKNWPKELENALSEYRKELEGRMEPAAPSTSLSDYSWAFHALRKDTMGSPLSYQREEYDVRHIQELFGDMDMLKIRPIDIQAAYANSRNSGRFSETEIRRIHVKLRQILQSAVNNGIIDKNPCHAIQLPKQNVEARKSLSQEDASRFLKCLLGEEQSPSVVCSMLLIHLGLRKGEALGLSWKDINLADETLTIERQFTNDRTERSPKSKQSRRTIAMDRSLSTYLAEWKSKQADLLERMAIAQTGETPVVHCIRIVENGNARHAETGRVDGHNYSRWFRDFCVDNGFGSYGVITKTFEREGKMHYRGRHYSGLVPHALRHTSATLLIASGVDVKTVQTRLGHADASTTLSIYTHAVRANDRAAASTMESLLQSKK